jgi:hypothetical protein
MVGVVAAALITATAVSIWQAARATEAQHQADADRKQAEADRDRARTAEGKAETNLERAREAEQRAATEAAIARAVNDFLQEDLLGQVTSVPGFSEAFAGDPHLTVREALDRAAAKIGDRFQNQPLVEAAIRMTIGNAYKQLYFSGNRLAVPHLERAHELRQAHLGPDHPDTLASMQSLAGAYLIVDRHREAIALLERRLEIGKARLGPDHPETLRFMGSLANAYWSAGRWDISEPLYEQLLDKRRAICGPTHLATLNAMHQLAMNYWDTDRFKESMALHAKVLNGLASTYGPGHDLKIWNLLTFAQVCQRAGDLDRADQLLREALVQNRKWEDSLARRSARANSLGWLALNLLLQKRHGDAERIAREALAIAQAEPFRPFYWKSVLGAALLGQKKYADAEPLLLQGYDGMKQRETGVPEGERRRLLTDAGERVVRFYEDTGQPERARAWRERLSRDHSKK